MTVPDGLNPDKDLGLMLYDVYDLDVIHSGGKAKADPCITFFPARLAGGILEIPQWQDVKKQLGGAP